MRSTTPSRRRSCGGRPPADLLEATARIVDEASAHDDTHLLIYLTLSGRDIELGLKPLEHDEHPFDALAGFTAPDEWTAFGLRALGTLRHLDEPALPAERAATTILLDRHGAEVSLNRTGSEVQLIPGRGEGTIPDTCRRVLGLPTTTAPPSTAVLWTLAWLDRLLDTWGQPSERRRLTSSWREVAGHHPALDHIGTGSADPLDDPATLVSIAKDHARSWPWDRLRAEPEALLLPHGNLSSEVTSWMDDGFYARWAVGAYPPIHTLATDLPALLGEPLGSTLIATALQLLED